MWSLKGNGNDKTAVQLPDELSDKCKSIAWGYHAAIAVVSYTD
jgi:hypothetical protein